MMAQVINSMLLILVLFAILHVIIILYTLPSLKMSDDNETVDDPYLTLSSSCSLNSNGNLDSEIANTIMNEMETTLDQISASTDNEEMKKSSSDDSTIDENSMEEEEEEEENDDDELKTDESECIDMDEELDLPGDRNKEVEGKASEFHHFRRKIRRNMGAQGLYENRDVTELTSIVAT